MYDEVEIITEAWRFASLKHIKQTYEGHEAGVQYPYLMHLGLVWQEMVWAFSQYTPAQCNVTDAYVCAILHDILEDTNASYEEVAVLFGKNIADGVLALTKQEHLPSKETQMLDSLLRICQQPPEISMVKMADRITNLSPPPHYWSKEKIARYQKEAQLIYDTLSFAHEPLALRLKSKIEAYSAYL